LISTWVGSRIAAQALGIEYGWAGASQGRKEPTGFGDGFFILSRAIGVGHNSSPNVEMHKALPIESGPDQNAQLTLAIESEISKSPGIRAPSNGFQFIDDFHGANFWRARNA